MVIYTEQLLACLVLTRCTKHPVDMVFGVVTNDDDDVMLLFIFPHDLRLNMAAYIKCLEETVLRQKWLLEDATSGNKTLSHTT